MRDYLDLELCNVEHIPAQAPSRLVEFALGNSTYVGVEGADIVHTVFEISARSKIVVACHQLCAKDSRVRRAEGSTAFYGDTLGGRRGEALALCQEPMHLAFCEFLAGEIVGVHILRDVLILVKVL